MRLCNILFRFFICILLLPACHLSRAQTHKRLTRTTKQTLELVKKEAARAIPLSTAPRPLEHSPNKTDYQRYNEHKNLITEQPTKSNHELYFLLAHSLWHLNKLEEAEKMFLTIIASQEDFYTKTYHLSSDLPGDTTSNIYGYGSYTSNYKNKAATYLAKIYIEQKDFKKALSYLDDAVHKYEVSYSCGTAHMWQQAEYDFLYVKCNEGLNITKEQVNTTK